MTIITLQHFRLDNCKLVILSLSNSHNTTLSHLDKVPPRVELNARMQKGLKVKAQTTILLEAEVFGKPMPRVTWRRGDDSLKSGEGQVITQQRNHYQLEMTAVTKEHTGTYTITAENASGTKTAEIQVNVLGENFSSFIRGCLFETVAG